jgi:hypothetical protein
MRTLIDASDLEMDAAFAQERVTNQRRAGDTALPENHRLVLQYLADHEDESSSGIPMWLEPNDLPSDLIERFEKPIGIGISVVRWRLRENGKQALLLANTELGDKASRYVSRLRVFGYSKPIVHGYPFLVPLKQRVWRFEGTLVSDKPPLVWKILSRI